MQVTVSPSRTQARTILSERTRSNPSPVSAPGWSPVPPKSSKAFYDAPQLSTKVIDDIVLIFCPRCLAVQTVQLSPSGSMVPTRKFRQVSGDIYHDCGSKLPCRLFMVNRNT